MNLGFYEVLDILFVNTELRIKLDKKQVSGARQFLNSGHLAGSSVLVQFVQCTINDFTGVRLAKSL